MGQRYVKLRLLHNTRAKLSIVSSGRVEKGRAGREEGKNCHGKVLGGSKR